jgi:hypothetical protein
MTQHSEKTSLRKTDRADSSYMDSALQQTARRHVQEYRNFDTVVKKTKFRI